MLRALVGFSLSLALPLAVQAESAMQCQALRHQRDAIASQAMAAEIALVHSLRLRLCPQQELLAEQAHAGGALVPGSGPSGAATVSSGEPAPPLQGETIDYAAYIRCRQAAEVQLRRSRVVLYTNQQGFSFYTLNGARLAREADALRPPLLAACERPAALQTSR